MVQELNVRVIGENIEDLEQFISTILEKYPRSYTGSPLKNTRPPYLGGYRQFLTVVLEAAP